MGWIARFFRREPACPPQNRQRGQAVSASPETESRRPALPVTLAELQALVPCNQLSPAELEHFLSTCKRYAFAPGERLFIRGQREENACGPSHATDGIALTETEALCIPNTLMLAAVDKKRAPPIEARRIAEDFNQLPDELRQSEVFYTFTFWRTYRSDSLQSHHFPGVLP